MSKVNIDIGSLARGNGGKFLLLLGDPTNGLNLRQAPSYVLSNCYDHVVFEGTVTSMLVDVDWMLHRIMFPLAHARFER